MSDLVNLIVETCTNHGTHVCIVGDCVKEIYQYQQAFADRRISNKVYKSPEVIPYFSVVVFLKIHNEQLLEQFKGFNYNTKCCTVIDTQGYVDLNMCAQYLDFAKVHKQQKGDYSELNVDNDGFFRSVIFQIFPELRKHSSQIAVIYDGATPQHALYRVDFEQTITHIKKMFSNGRTKIIFYNGDETIQDFSVMAAQRVAEYFGDSVPAGTFFYFSSGLQAEQAYADFCATHGFDTKVVMMAANRFETVLQQNVKKINREHADCLSTPYRIESKEKNFVCFNRMPRRHRCMLLHKLWNKNLVKDSYYSFGTESPPMLVPGHETGDAEALEWFNANQSMFPMVLNMNSQSDNPVDINISDIKYHSNSYFSLVCETYFYYNSSVPKDISYMNSVFISEKLYKPLAFKHPFVLVAYPGTLQCIRDTGYKTFHPYIDESYDNILDDTERMDFIVDQVQQLCSQSTEQWQQWQQGIADIVEHNYNWLCTDKDLRITKHIESHFTNTEIDNEH